MNMRLDISPVGSGLSVTTAVANDFAVKAECKNAKVDVLCKVDGVLPAIYSITTSLENVTSDAPATIGGGNALYVTLAAASGKTILPSSVSVIMGEDDITATAYDDATNTITIDSVSGDVTIEATAMQIIIFEDDAVKTICVANWGGHYFTGEITTVEAAAVTSLADKFYTNTDITKFNELQYFTGLTSLYSKNVSSYPAGQFYNCDYLRDITFPAAPISDLRGVFRSGMSTGDANIEVDLTPITATTITFGSAFRETTKVKKVILPGVAYSGSWQYAFRADTALATIEIDGTADLSQVTSFSNAFYNCTALETITGTITGISVAISFANSSKLTRDSLLVILNGLADLTGKTGLTLTLHATAKARLTADDLAIASGKNWTV